MTTDQLVPRTSRPIDQFRREGREGRRGFTLIELLAVILIIGILAVALLPMVTEAIDSANVTACNQNLGKIYGAMIIYKGKFKELPKESGVAFFAQLISRGAMENTKTNADRMTCPAIEKGALTIGDLPWEEWWMDLEFVDGNYSAYAGRDLRNFPLRKLSGREPLIADDNDGGMNHNTTTNVLYGDGSVQTFELALLREEGLLMEDEDVLLLGPDSPVDDLIKMSLD